MELADVYSGNRGWSDLLEAAGLPTERAGPQEANLRRGIGRLLHIDDEERLQVWREVAEQTEPPDLVAADVRTGRLLWMLTASVGSQVLAKDASPVDAVRLLWEHPQVRSELVELFNALSDGVDHLHVPLRTHGRVPLHIHARYTRIEILAAFGLEDVASVRTWPSGVRWADEEQADLFAFTLDKSARSFSPTTRYRDYAISRELIHWESQSATRADSETGQRYQHHEAKGTAVMLFARQRVAERAFWFLGPATYVRHDGERPMAIRWRLEHPLPGDLYATFAAAVA
jgi:hypothetical protein